ncbi:hypothetical protein AKJ39_00930 [candidate division MSBL1 archaeon SCGC-AAA259J03]|uniref:Cell division protein FtsZ n=1 Tax=candidate division MSBL1 archaeon SCGC-AAA259J03 TaxID=1698269 RepID=A0A656YX27_9EURY|nr:hypothetical protein AKJ39_00930 [candidate division MSBL1 archaeon SCGC-AAA259J03]
MSSNNSPPENSIDNYESTVLHAQPEIILIGCGGAGGNTVSRLMENGNKSVKTFAVNTDAQDLLYTVADEKILIGRDITGGLGAGNDPEKGRNAAEDSRTKLRDSFPEADLAFITCGLGGGTGTGAGPVVADVIKRMGTLTVGVITLPFESEGRKRARNAALGLKRFRETLDSIVIIPDDKLLEIAPDLSILEAFELADNLLANSIEGISELITKPGLINLDFADIKTVLKEAGITMIGLGESDSENRAVEATRKAIESPLLDAELSKVDEALVNIQGSPDMSLEEAEKIAGEISKHLASNAQITWGAQINKDLEGTIKVMVLVPNVETPWEGGILEKRKHEDVEDILSEFRSL